MHAGSCIVKEPAQGAGMSACWALELKRCTWGLVACGGSVKAHLPCPPLNSHPRRDGLLQKAEEVAWGIMTDDKGEMAKLIQSSVSHTHSLPDLASDRICAPVPWAWARSRSWD